MKQGPGLAREACPHCGTLNALGNVVCHSCGRRLCETNPFMVNDGPEVYWEQVKTGSVYQAWVANPGGGSMLEWWHQDLLLTVAGIVVVAASTFCYLTVIFSGIA